MAQFTNCTSVDDLWDGGKPFDNPINFVLSIGGLAAFVYAAYAAIGILVNGLALAAATPYTLLAAGIALLAAATAFLIVTQRGRDYFFSHRLVCVREHQCALGMVQSLEDDGDGDRAVNLIMAPADFNNTSLNDYKSSIQGRLIFGTDDQNPPVELPVVSELKTEKGWNIVADANRPDFPGARTWGIGKLPLFHCEVEGTKFDDWTSALIAYLLAIIILAAGIIAAASGMIAGTIALAAAGPIGWIILALILLFLILAALFNSAISGDKGEDAVDPSNYPTAIPDPSGPILTGDNRTIEINDFVVAYGRYIIDTGHNPDCWCELHPLRAITKIESNLYLEFPTDIDQSVEDDGANLKMYCAALQRFATERGRLTAVALEHRNVG